MNVHKIILPYVPESLKRLLDIKKTIDEKIYNGEDISEELKQISNGDSELPRGLHDILHYKVVN